MIFDKLVYNKTMPDKKVAIKPEEPKGLNTSPTQKKPSATALMQKFLIENRIKLVQVPIVQNIKQVSDGSVILSLPAITAEYIDG